MVNFIKLLRVHQWIKNLIIFFPVFFGGEILNKSKLSTTVIGFIAFCFLSSSSYIINDIKDREKDRIHPKKCNRPIASGQVDVKSALFISILLFMTSMTIGLSINLYFLFIMLLYFINVNFYTFWLKKIVFVDILSIALGFVIRLYAGGVASNTNPSLWLIGLTLLVSIMLGIGKRYEEIMLNDNIVKENLQNYDHKVARFMLILSGTLSIVLFGIYLNPRDVYGFFLLLISSILVFNYIFNVLIKNIGEPTEFFMKNKVNFILLTIWILLFFKRIYIQ